MISTKWSSFQQLSTDELYEILSIRQQVFTVEQRCPYQDADGLDRLAWHLQALDTAVAPPRLCGYLRVLPPGSRFSEPAIGRLLVAPELRHCGLARELMREALSRIALLYPGMPTRISAQLYLQDLYRDFGFAASSPIYDEDGIAHLDMLRPAEQPG